ncbi:FAD-dependent oxidoreductase [Duodenibacillus massiliensis]|uniref:FAD-dependent oxidoreductase n=1 Tax=Duodenibacillus massiliensis TaxID=1852381 RepID=UPI0023A819CC|nr:FAD-dependent oxidoreductase [Duodenibacillus massiliensis]
MIARRTVAKAALAAALLGQKAFASEEEAPWDVLVAGSGAAGLTAAATAREAGASRVLILEKGPLVGGHSVYSSGSLAVVSPRRQKPQGIEDSAGILTEEARRIGGSIDVPMVRFLAEHSEEAADWLEAQGVEFSSVVFQALGGLRPRCISPAGSAGGRHYITVLNRRVRELGCELRLMHKLENLTHENGLWRFTVLNTRDGSRHTGLARTVILACGGFTANTAMRMRWDPRIDMAMPTTANPQGLYFDGATGDGIALADKLGAQLAGMENILLLAYSGGRLLEYAGAEIYLTMQGKRFVNEGASTGEISDAIFDLPEKAMWVITDARSFKGTSLGIKLANGYVHKSETLEAMARGMDIEPFVLRRTLARYNKAVAEKKDADFGKTVFLQTIEKPPFYWGKEVLSVHNTLGGISTDTACRVRKVGGGVIEGLYAAGETAGGIFGRDRLGGMQMTACFVMGRTAGREAAQRALQKL